MTAWRIRSTPRAAMRGSGRRAYPATSSRAWGGEEACSEDLLGGGGGVGNLPPAQAFCSTCGIWGLLNQSQREKISFENIGCHHEMSARLCWYLCLAMQNDLGPVMLTIDPKDLLEKDAVSVPADYLQRTGACGSTIACFEKLICMVRYFSAEAGHRGMYVRSFLPEWAIYIPYGKQDI